MKNIRLFSVVLIAFCSLASLAQVDEIKKASKENSSKSSKSSVSSSEGGNSGGGNSFIVFDMFRVLGAWQSSVLQKRPEVPTLVGLDFMVHGAIQPSSYYVINPRVRGTWGILSTDFRTNYLIEENVEGNKSLTSYDWQIFQLNFVNTKNVIVRTGTGFMKEGFGDHNSFFEWTLSTNLMFNENKWGGFAEFRSAPDFNSGAVPRREISMQVQRQIFSSGHWHGLATGGFQFQEYYQTVDVWGIQMGIVFKLY